MNNGQGETSMGEVGRQARIQRMRKSLARLSAAGALSVEIAWLRHRESAQQQALEELPLAWPDAERWEAKRRERLEMELAVMAAG